MTPHAKLIDHVKSLANTTFSEFSSDRSCDVPEASLQKKFRHLVSQERFRYSALIADIREWRENVTSGEVDFEYSQEHAFKEAIRRMISLEKLLIEQFDERQKNGLLLAKPSMVKQMESRLGDAEQMLSNWKSPEWETQDARTVHWNAEQSAYLLARLENTK